VKCINSKFMLVLGSPGPESLVLHSAVFTYAYEFATGSVKRGIIAFPIAFI